MISKKNDIKGFFVAINIEFERSKFKMSPFSFSEHPTFVACLGPQQILKYVTVSLIFILYISKMRICTKVYASILSLIFLKYCIYIIIKVLGINIFDIQKTWSL